jgi:hypothetical protein
MGGEALYIHSWYTGYTRAAYYQERSSNTIDGRMRNKFNSMQWTWKVFLAEHIPIMFSDLKSSSNYVSMLDKIRSRVSEINGRRLNISALPALSKSLESLALSELARVQLIGPLYVSGRTIRYVPVECLRDDLTYLAFLRATIMMNAQKWVDC